MARNRSRQGEDRREQLLETAARILAEDGPGALTHRALAREAAAPLSSTTYYFDSLQDIADEAVKFVAERDIARLRSVRWSEGGPTVTEFVDVLSGYLMWELNEERALLLLQYEHYLAAARREELRALRREWNHAYMLAAEPALRILGSADPLGDARLLLAAVDGLLLQQLSAPEPHFEEHILEPLLTRLVAGMVNRAPTAPAGARAGRRDPPR